MNSVMNMVYENERFINLDDYYEVFESILQIFWSIIGIYHVCILFDYIKNRMLSNNRETEYRLFVKKVNDYITTSNSCFVHMEQTHASFEKKIASIIEKNKFPVKRDEITDLRLKCAYISSDLVKQNGEHQKRQQVLDSELKNIIKYVDTQIALSQTLTHNDYENQLLAGQLVEQVATLLLEPNNKIHSLEQGLIQINNNMRTLKEQMKVQTNNLSTYEEVVKNSLTEQLVQTNNNVCKMKEQIKVYMNQTDSKIQELQETSIPREEMIHYMKKRTTSDNLFG